MAGFCYKCGAKLNESSKFCTSCGTPVRQIGAAQNTPYNVAPKSPKCAYCGAELKATTKFCPSCGKQQTEPTKLMQTPKQTYVKIPGPLKCEYCGAVHSAKSKFCPKCGKAVTPKVLEQASPAPQTGSSTTDNIAKPFQQNTQNVIGQATQPVRQAAQNVVGQATQPMRQAAQNVVGQATVPVRQAMGGFGGIANAFNAILSPGEVALNLPEMSAASSAASAVGSGGLPGFVIPLISGAVAGGVSIPLLNNLAAPWSFMVGLLISGASLVISFFIKKHKGGKSK